MFRRSDSPQPQTLTSYGYGPMVTTTLQHKKYPSTASTTSGLGGSNFSTSLGSQTQPPTPSPRRKISTASFNENLEYSENDGRPLLEFHIGGGGGGAAPPLYAPSDYLRNGPRYGKEVAADYGGRTAYFGKFRCVSFGIYL